MSRVPSILFAGRLASALAAAIVGCAAPALAQYPGHVDESTQPGTVHLRATAVLEYTGDLGKMKNSRLIPIAIWDGTQYQPASLYLAQPAPLAVLNGTQYELESAGQPKGFFDVSEAEQLAGLWIGVGKYQPPPPPPPRAPLTARNHVYEMKDYDPDKPHFAYVPPGHDSQNGAAAPAATTKKAPPVDPDRPILHDRPSGSSTDNSGSSNTTAASTAPPVDPDRPTFSRREESPAPASTPASSVQAAPADPNRPHLSYTAPATQLKLDRPDALAGLPPDMKQIAGVSDSRTLDHESWQFIWSNPDDEAKMKAELEHIAAQALAPPSPPAPPAAAKTAARRRKQAPDPAPAPLPMLTDEEFRAFNLSFGGGATMVFSARATGNPAKYVTLIAQPDFYGNPQVLLRQVTNTDELDAVPRMRLVDAVDTIGNGRADLIFELRGQTYRQFAIYRMVGGTANRVFVTQPAPDR